jgi:RNase P subunit RPR2
MLAYTDTEIERILRNARLLFEKLDRVLDSPNDATETYRMSIEKLVDFYKIQKNITSLKADIERQYTELQKLLGKIKAIALERRLFYVLVFDSNIMAKLKSKPCARCSNLVDIRYRIKDQQKGDWMLVCPDCWQQVSQDNPDYRYGGTWKAKKK